MSALAVLVAVILTACGMPSDNSSESTGTGTDAGNHATTSTDVPDNSATEGCDIERPASGGSDDEGVPFDDIQADVFLKCGWPDNQVGVLGMNATYWLSPFSTKLGEETCMFWVYHAEHVTSYVTPTILSGSKVTIRAQYVGVDGANNGFAPGSVTVDNIYQVTPDFILSLRDGDDIDLSECGKTTPES